MAALEKMSRDGSWGRYHGEHCEQLRAAIAKMHDAEHVALVASGTIAVELALRGLGIGTGDEVILAAYDFPGNFRAIECVGATPVLVDICQHTWCLDAEQLETAISSSTKAVIVSHLHGGLANMRSIESIARKHGISIVEDACQSPGAVVDGRTAGTWGDVSVWSFGGSKLLSAGRGGAVMTRDDRVMQRIKVFAHRGNDAFALSEMQAAVLIPQLKQLAQCNAQRLQNVLRLTEALDGLEALRGLRQNNYENQPAYYKVPWCFEPAVSDPTSREDAIAAFAAEGIAIDAGFRGFAGRSERRCRKHGELKHARAAAQATLILHHPILLENTETIEKLARTMRRVIENVSHER